MEKIYVADLITVTAAVVVAAGIPALLPRFPLPGVVLEILAGVMIGPQVLGLVEGGVVPSFLARFGPWILFFAAGFEMGPDVLRGRGLRNAVGG